MKEAKYYRELDGKVECRLCPQYCIINPGKYGICRVRKNEEGKLITHSYGHIVARHIDPIEKKPLYHFYPGKRILSIGTPGCNLRCFFCQNCGISQTGSYSFSDMDIVYPDELVHNAKNEKNNIGIAYTYNEPTVYFEYMLDTAQLAKKEGLKNVMVSNGFISDEPLQELLPYIDAFNIDLKSFSDNFYKKHTKSSIYPVMDSLETIHRNRKHLEITYLVIPGLNDDEQEFKEMTEWIYKYFGDAQVLHISRYFPNYQSNIPATSLSVLEKLRNIALEKLAYVFLGNASISEGQISYCHNCRKEVIVRDYFTVRTNINENGECNSCNTKILKYF